jgi:hypothetical protein
MGAEMSDERPFHERDLYRRYVDRGIAIDTALKWLKANDCTAMHESNCALSEWRDESFTCTCAFGRLVKQLEGVR